MVATSAAYRAIPSVRNQTRPGIGLNISLGSRAITRSSWAETSRELTPTAFATTHEADSLRDISLTILVILQTQTEVRTEWHRISRNCCSARPISPVAVLVIHTATYIKILLV